MELKNRLTIWRYILSYANKVGVAFVADKIKEVWLRWFKHVRRRCADAPIKRYKRLTISYFEKVNVGRRRTRR